MPIRRTTQQRVYPLQKEGVCFWCNQSTDVWLVGGFSHRYAYDYLCLDCYLQYVGDPVSSTKCTGCGCTLTQSFQYPKDAAIENQKPYCTLCYQFTELQDYAYSKLPKKERSFVTIALRKLLKKEKEVGTNETE